MKMSAGDARGRGPDRLQVENRLDQVARARGLTESQVADRVAPILGHRPDRRTVRRFLSGAPIADPTMATFLAFCRALDVTMDSALTLRRADEVGDLLRRAGVRFRPPSDETPPDTWPQVDPAWGELVEPYLRERHRDFEA